MKRKFLLVFYACIFCFLAPLITKAQTITPGSVSGTISTCIGSPSSSPNIQQFTVTGTGLTNDLTVAAPGNFEVSLAENTGYSTGITIPKAAGAINATVYVRAAGTAGLGKIKGKVMLTSSPATPQSVDVSGNVNALPTVNAVGDQTKNNGEQTDAIRFTGTSGAYRWTNDNPAIGLPASGTGDIPSFTAINKGTAPVTANIIVTPQSAGFIYTADFNGPSVSVINRGTNKVITTIPVDAGPYKTLVSPDNTRVYVANSNGETISVIDALSNKMLSSINVGANPITLNITPDGSKLFVCSAGANAVSVISTVDNSVIATIPVSIDPFCSAMSPDGSRLYVGSGVGDISVINTADNSLDGTISPMWDITAMALNADGSRLYVSIASNSVVVISTADKTIMTSIPAGTDPYLCLDINPVGDLLYVANANSNTVTAIDTRTNTVAATIPVGEYCMPIAISPDRKYVYAPGRISQTLSVISTATNKVISTISVPGLLDGAVVSPDGSRVYITDDGSNSVHVINTANNTVITDISTGTNPLMYQSSFSKGDGCDGLSKTFKITVNAATPVINTSSIPSAVSTIYGTPSSSSSFVVSGKDLTQGITITPPAGFEISTDNINFSNSLTVGSAGSVNDITIYTRLAAITNVGTYSGDFTLKSAGAADVKVPIENSTVSPYTLNVFGHGDKLYGEPVADATYYYNTPGFVFPDPGLQNGETFYSLHFALTGGAAADAPVGTYSGAVVVSDFQGANGFLASNYILNYIKGDMVVHPAPLTIAAKPVNKPYGTTLTNIPASTDFTVTGLKNDETIGSASIAYGSGAAATDPAGVYNGSVSVSGVSGGTFDPANYDITYLTADITVSAATPVITLADALSPVNTIYGTPSGSSPFTVSGNALSTGITVTPPPGFEVSTDNVNFSNTVIVGAGGTVNATTIYIRLAAITDAGPYDGNITLTAGATQTTVFMPASTVSPAPLTIAGINETKTYGTALQNYTGPAKYVITAGNLKNGNTISSVSIDYGTGADAGSPAGKYSGSVKPTVITGDNGFKATNYIILFANAHIIVLPANLTITANNETRNYGTDNPILTFTYSGFVNGDTEAQLNTLPAAATTATIASAPGKYPITVSGAASANYTFTYIKGVLTVIPLPDAVLVVPNTFTPNGDGINDAWNLPALASYPNCTVNIYDRYGQVMFRSIGYPTPWDGRYNGKDVPTGVYYYIIDKKNNTGPVSGSLTVLR